MKILLGSRIEHLALLNEVGDQRFGGDPVDICRRDKLFHKVVVGLLLIHAVGLAGNETLVDSGGMTVPVRPSSTDLGHVDLVDLVEAQTHC